MLTQSPQDSKGQPRHSSTRTAAKPSRAARSPQAPPVSTSDSLKALIAKRAYERYAEQGVPARLRAGRLAGGRTRDLEPGSPVKLMGSTMGICR
jgi:hypothetical protein